MASQFSDARSCRGAASMNSRSAGGEREASASCQSPWRISTLGQLRNRSAAAAASAGSISTETSLVSGPIPLAIQAAPTPAPVPCSTIRLPRLLAATFGLQQPPYCWDAGRGRPAVAGRLALGHEPYPASRDRTGGKAQFLG